MRRLKGAFVARIYDNKQNFVRFLMLMFLLVFLFYALVAGWLAAGGHACGLALINISLF